MSMPADEFIAALQKLVDGLTYPSESDEPVDVFILPASPKESPRHAIEQFVGGHGPIETQGVADFFDALTPSDDAKTFDALRTLLTEHMSQVSVFRVGKTQVDVFVIGRFADQWIGVQTRSIET